MFQKIKKTQTYAFNVHFLIYAAVNISGSLHVLIYNWWKITAM